MIKRSAVLALYNENPSSTQAAEKLLSENIVEKLQALDSRIAKKGFDGLNPARDVLVRIGTEFDKGGVVSKNSYGMFNLSWKAADHPEWPAQVEQELADIKAAIRATHGTSIRFLIWAGMGGSAEDKALYNALGLLRNGPRVYILDSTDPAKLKAILASMVQRSRKGLQEVLKSTLVAGMALGMTSYEPVLNMQKLAALYRNLKLDSRPNFIYMTLPGSLLDQFGQAQGYRKVELQLDNGNSTSGRHSAPLTKGSLYPLSLAGNDLAEWMRGTFLSEEEIGQALRLATFLWTQCHEGRDKVTLLLPKPWQGASIWTKQNFEESLGKSEEFGIKLITGEAVKLVRYAAPKDSSQDRCFLAFQFKGQANPDAKKTTLLRRAGYPVAVVTLASPGVSKFMQFVHYTVFGIGYLEKMNFVTQPGVELYKAITNKVHTESENKGGVEKTSEWISFQNSPRRLKYRGGITLGFDKLPDDIWREGKDPVAAYAYLLRSLTADHRVEYAELTFFGDMRYSERGRQVKKVLERAGDSVFRSTLKRPVDIYEGPAMNHSYHEMIIGHGRCFSTVLLSEKPESIAEAGYTADYHRAQFLATQMALAQKDRLVVSITLKDLEPTTLQSLDTFFAEVARLIRAKRKSTA